MFLQTSLHWKIFGPNLEKISKICKQSCKNVKIIIVFTSCNSFYIGRTCCNLKTRTDEHMKKKDKKVNISKYLRNNGKCSSCFN